MDPFLDCNHFGIHFGMHLLLLHEFWEPFLDCLFNPFLDRFLDPSLDPFCDLVREGFLNRFWDLVCGGDREPIKADM